MEEQFEFLMKGHPQAGIMSFVGSYPRHSHYLARFNTGRCRVRLSDPPWATVRVPWSSVRQSERRTKPSRSTTRRGHVASKVLLFARSRSENLRDLTMALAGQNSAHGFSFFTEKFASKLQCHRRLWCCRCSFPISGRPCPKHVHPKAAKHGFLLQQSTAACCVVQPQRG